MSLESPKKLTILVFSASNLIRDPRIRRHIIALKKKHNVICTGNTNPNIEGVPFFPVYDNRSFIEKLLCWIFQLIGLYHFAENIYLKMLLPIKNEILKIDYDIILINDIENLPLAFKIRKNAKTIIDAHEYAPDQDNIRLLWRLLFKRYMQYLCLKYLKKCDGMITVTVGIAEEYFKNFNVNSVVITNASDYRSDISPCPILNNNIRIINHGSASPNRKIESMIEMMKYTDPRFSLTLMLIPVSPRYINKLKKLAKGMNNVHFLDPVPMHQIVDTINDFDIGLHIIEPTSINNLMMFPNKFFEFIQARLAIAIGPSPEMVKIVHKFDLGIVAEDFNPKTMARRLNQLTAEDILNYKQNSHHAAYELSSERNMILLDEIVKKVGGT